jgi:hypothetical protein
LLSHQSSAGKKLNFLAFGVLLTREEKKALIDVF